MSWIWKQSDIEHILMLIKNKKWTRAGQITHKLNKSGNPEITEVRADREPGEEIK